MKTFMPPALIALALLSSAQAGRQTNTAPPRPPLTFGQRVEYMRGALAAQVVPSSRCDGWKWSKLAGTFKWKFGKVIALQNTLGEDVTLARFDGNYEGMHTPITDETPNVIFGLQDLGDGLQFTAVSFSLTPKHILFAGFEPVTGGTLTCMADFTK